MNESGATRLGMTIADGLGAKQTPIGTGRDDASDARDRRVEFTVIDCTAKA